MNRKGFTLIEILLVVVIMGIMLAVIVPRAWRANVDAKYSIVRQNASEAAKYGLQWAEDELMAQNDADSTARLVNYLAYLCDSATGGVGTSASWLARTYGAEGWQTASAVTGRVMGATANAPVSGPAEAIFPKDKAIRNPFNGLYIFDSGNDPTANAVPGTLASGFIGETDGWYYFALTFQGTENTGITTADMHGNMDATSLAGLRNGVFMARAK